MFTDVVDQPGSKLLSLPAEVRLNILNIALPDNDRLVLDPENRFWPGPIPASNYEPTSSLLVVSKQLYNEIIPILYGHNTVAVIEPSVVDNEIFQQLSDDALKQITKVELCIGHGLTDIGDCQVVLSDALPALKSLRLNMWHSRWWLKTALELAHRSYVTGKFTLKLDMFKSIFADYRRSPLDHNTIHNALLAAYRVAAFYQLHIPDNIKLITISASVGQDDASKMVTFEPSPHFYPTACVNKWKFRKDGNKDTNAIKYLILQSGMDDAMDSSK